MRVPYGDDARFAADEMLEVRISIVELTMTVPGALGVISELARSHPDFAVGAGTVHRARTENAYLPV